MTLTVQNILDFHAAKLAQKKLRVVNESERAVSLNGEVIMDKQNTNNEVIARNYDQHRCFLANKLNEIKKQDEIRANAGKVIMDKQNTNNEVITRKSESFNVTKDTDSSQKRCKEFLNLNVLFENVPVYDRDQQTVLDHVDQLVEVPTNNTGSDPTKSLGLGITYLQEGCNARMPKTTPTKDKTLANCLAKLGRVGAQILKEVTNRLNSSNESKVIAYHLCTKTKQYHMVDGKLVEDTEDKFIPCTEDDNIDYLLSLMGEDSQKVICGTLYILQDGILFKQSKGSYHPTPANLVLSTDKPIDDENKCTTENTDDGFDLPY